MTRLRVGIIAVLWVAAATGYSWEWQGLDVDKAAKGGTQLFKAARGLNEKEEVRLGREVAAQLAARYGLVENPAKLKYLNLVGHAVAQRSSRPELRYRFGILRSPEFNAFAAPGGYIFVTEGLLNFLQDEAELAGVLAHEISHVTERHIVKAIREANLLGAGKDLAAAAGRDLEAYGPLSDFSVNLLEKGLSRKDELAADREGTRLAAQVGYDPRGLRDTVQRLNSLQSKDPILARFHSTHPPATERLKVIEAMLKKEDVARAPRLSDRYTAALRR